MTAREIGQREHPWLYTANGDLDLSWVLLVVGCAILVASLLLQGFHIAGFDLPVAAWSCLGSFTALCFVAGAARDRATILAGATMPGEVGRAIASVRPLVRLIDDPDA